MVLIKDKCAICGTLLDLSFLNPKRAAGNLLSSFETNIFTAWKQECSIATCEVFFGNRIDFIVNYFQDAHYCTDCEQTVRDLGFTWKQIQLFEKTVLSLSTKIRELLELNYYKINEKSQPKGVQKRIAPLLKRKIMEPESTLDYSYEDMLEIIYSAVSKAQRSSNNTNFSGLKLLQNNSIRHSKLDEPDELQKVDLVNVKIEDSDMENFSKENDESLSFQMDIALTNKAQTDTAYSDQEELNDESEGFESDQAYCGEKCNEGLSSPGDHDTRKKKKLNSKNIAASAKVKAHIMMLNRNKYKFSCLEEECYKRFPDKKSLQGHVKIVHKGEDEAYNCTECSIKFLNETELIKHNLDVHEKEKPVKRSSVCNETNLNQNDLIIKSEPTNFHCTFCSANVFDNAVDLRKHVQESHSGPMCCEICQKTYINGSSLSNHLLKYHKRNKNILLYCSICDKKFAQKTKLENHMKKKHKSESINVDKDDCQFLNKQKTQEIEIENESFQCKVCEITLTSKDDYKNHESTHLETNILPNETQSNKTKQKSLKLSATETNEQNYECKFCSKAYTKEDELNSHYSVSHKGPNPFICGFCPEIYSNSMDLQIHTKEKHVNPNHFAGKRKCETCGRYFASRYSLSKHRKSHLDPSLLFKCQLCPSIFKQKYYLNKHVETHQEERKYMCEICGKGYKSSDCLYAHSRTHDENQRKYKCKVCDKKFFTRTLCKFHEVSHSNVNHFVCHVCGKAFNRPHNLNQHLKIHSGQLTRKRRVSKLKQYTDEIVKV